ncbi:MAG: GDYXXLXY domain-containing protein, partial [Calditrichaeota bacterium]|nr:GDYXXLXY domain-containing protein [Calditrichota bacterium]
MKNKYILIALVVFQLAIVGGMLLMAMLPLLTGQPVQLEVTLRDPRDLFRGNYVYLFYDINRLPLDSLENDLPKEGNLN